LRFLELSFAIATLLLTGCASSPKPLDPPRLKAALEAESEGAKRFSRGEFAIAARRFDAAARIYAGIDDTSAATRNRLHLARSELALGRAEAALLALAGGDDGMALETRLLQAQAQLALGRNDEAGQSLANAATLCAASCPQLPSLHLLQARAALTLQHPAQALSHAESALNLLRDKDEANETGNAWRLIATARLAAGDAAAALPAAEAALDIDRRLALPEKIARDWLLIGDIQQKVGAGETALAAYQRALAVANAAALPEVIAAATQALAALKSHGEPPR
jgi:tetratricopeptide (TPR) repeat protein